MAAVERKVRVGMVGGGPGAGIAESHRIGMRIDDRYALVAGVFSRSAEKSLEAARKLGVTPERTYTSYEEMARAEAERPDGIDVVSIVTPNDSHHPIAKTFLDAGIHVICDKPLTDNLAHALELHHLAQARALIFALTHNYSGYAMVRHAGRLVRDGALGALRIVQVEHASGWAAHEVDSKQAAWRTDPAISGKASVVFDLGTHAHHLLRFVTGLEVAELSAEMATAVAGRRVFDDVHVNLRLSNGARGALWASMAATGQEHGLRIRVFGDKASLEWQHEDPHHLTIRHDGGPVAIFAQGDAGLSPEAERRTRVGLGHPEGFLESFANIYSDVAEAILECQRSGRHTPSELGFPSTRDGVLGVKFVEAVSQSYENGGAWTAASIAL
jgi:predicted dehydrogenase